MSLDSAAISAAVAALTITGVHIKGIGSVPPQPEDPDLPILCPNPDAWGGEASLVQITFGPDPTFECTRVFGYVYLHKQVGAGSSPADWFAAIADNRDAIMEKLFDAAGVDVLSVNSGPLSQLGWITGNSYHGCEISITVREMINP